MFHSDISFSSNEKAEQFGEDAKNFMISYKDALDSIKYIAYNIIYIEKKHFMTIQRLIIPRMSKILSAIYKIIMSLTRNL
jgi:hypothetical protein